MFRVRFKGIKDGRQRAVYFKDETTARSLKNNALIQRVNAESSSLDKRFKILLSLWKVKQAEIFYNKYLRKLFSDG